MTPSFLATIAFALLALIMVFLANLVGATATGSFAHVIGTGAAMAATGAAYLAQHYFTLSALWLHQHQTAIPVMTEAWGKHTSAERCGVMLQWGSVALALVAGALYVMGA